MTTAKALWPEPEDKLRHVVDSLAALLDVEEDGADAPHLPPPPRPWPPPRCDNKEHELGELLRAIRVHLWAWQDDLETWAERRVRNLAGTRLDSEQLALWIAAARLAAREEGAWAWALSPRSPAERRACCVMRLLQANRRGPAEIRAAAARCLDAGVSAAAVRRLI